MNELNSVQPTNISTLDLLFLNCFSTIELPPDLFEFYSRSEVGFRILENETVLQFGKREELVKVLTQHKLFNNSVSQGFTEEQIDNLYEQIQLGESLLYLRTANDGSSSLIRRVGVVKVDVVTEYPAIFLSLRKLFYPNPLVI